MCVTLSLADEEKRSTEIDNHDTDHQSEAMVRNVLKKNYPSNWIGKRKVADMPGRAHSGRYCR
jgi:hypothetical protein